MKCFEVTKCSEQDRASCYVWKTYKDLPQDMENIKCWVIKGVYQEENKAQLQKCRRCAYYLKMNENNGISSNLAYDAAVVSFDGVINNDKCKALIQVWANLKKNNKFKILMDISKVPFIYSCGLGVFVKIHKEIEANNGILVLVGSQPGVTTTLIGTKLDKLFRVAKDQNEAIRLFEDFKKKQELAIEAAKPKPAPLPPKPQPKTRIPCWEYWKGHNPRNATGCNECYKKISGTKDPCWIVEGFIEGISFQYTNEECMECKYYYEFCESTTYGEPTDKSAQDNPVEDNAIVAD